MFNIFRKHAKAETLVGSLLALVADVGKDDEKRVADLPGDLVVDRQRLMAELFYLRCFALDVAIFRGVANRQEMTRLSNCLHEALAASKSILDPHASLGDELHDRIDRYHQGSGPPSASSLGEGIGRTFAQLCGADDIALRGVGMLTFSIFLKYATEAIEKITRRYRVV